MTNLCNYSCDFCIQGTKEMHVEAARGESRELRSRICEAIIGLVENLKGFRKLDVYLIGGEVTFLNDFPALLEKLASCRFPGDMSFRITTNLSMPAETYCQLCEIIKRHDRIGRRRSFHIGASFYRSYTSWESFAAKLIEIADREVSWPRSPITRMARKLGERVLCSPIKLGVGIPLLADEDFDLLESARASMWEHRISVTPIIMRKYATTISERNLGTVIAQGRNGIRVTYSDGSIRDFENIQALGASLGGTETFCPRGYLCDAGTSSISIGPKGNVERCPVIGGTMHLGSLLDGTYAGLAELAPCTADHCSCNYYNVIIKGDSAIRAAINP